MSLWQNWTEQWHQIRKKNILKHHDIRLSPHVWSFHPRPGANWHVVKDFMPYCSFLAQTFAHMCMQTHLLAQIAKYYQCRNIQFISFTITINELHVYVYMCVCAYIRVHTHTHREGGERKRESRIKVDSRWYHKIQKVFAKPLGFYLWALLERLISNSQRQSWQIT